LRLLYVSDHRIDAYLVRALREAGHVAEAVDQPADGLAMVGGDDYQAVVLDWVGPVGETAARFAAAAPGALLMVIADADEGERSAILAVGADACFARPPSFLELDARLEALERLVRRVSPQGPPAEAAPTEMIPAERAVRLGGARVALSALEYRLMAHFIDHAGQVVGLEPLWRQVWGDEGEPRPDLARASVGRLRRKLAAAGAEGWLRAAAGHGWIFQPPPAT
jgi:DNA-binding response OmpR family regulator